jgi:hypothetical protein
MNVRTLTLAALAALGLGLAGSAGAQGFASTSSQPAAPAMATPPPVTPVAVAPAVPAPVPAATEPSAFGSVSNQPALAPPPPAPVIDAPAVTAAPPAAVAFSSVSSGGDAAAGSGPLLPAPARFVADHVQADRILVEKNARQLKLFSRGEVIAQYPIKLGLSPKGHKQYEGDFRTPEGVYYITRRNPYSDFFLSVQVSYPNDADLARARADGVRPGGLIMIHGQPNVPRKPRDYYAKNDWTDGCIAVSNSDMVDIWRRTRVGIPIEIRP